MVSIYKIKVDVINFQWLVPCDITFAEKGNLIFDGLPIRNKWNPPEFYPINPLLKRGNFVYVSGGFLCFDERVLKDYRLCGFFERAGEILPILLETGERFYVLNAIEIANALDIKKTKYDVNWDSIEQKQVPGKILEYAFHPLRFNGSSIFKISQTVRSEIFTYSACCGDAEEEFYYWYYKSDLTGADSSNTGTLLEIPPMSDVSSFSTLENGKVFFQSSFHNVIGTTTFAPTQGKYTAKVAGDQTGFPIGSDFRLYDDDDYGLGSEPLPLLDLVNDQMKNYFKPSFVIVVDASAFNPDKLIDLVLNEDVSHNNPGGFRLLANKS